MSGGVRSRRSGRLSSIGLLALVLGLTGVAFVLVEPLQGSRLPLKDKDELTLFPRSAWVRPLTFGRARLAADLAWLEAIQYYGRHRKSDRRYPHAETLFRTLTGLDPRFEAAYVFGALVLAEEAGAPARAHELLAEGIRNNPQSWRLCFEYGFFAYLRRKDSAEAVTYLTRASRMPGAPATVARLAAYAAGQAGERETAIELWREMLRSADNEEVRRIARGYLRRLGAPEAASFPAEETAREGGTDAVRG
jgi:tetratricopeptide (TPR) repeat protein